MAAFIRDLEYGVRALRQRPGFAAVAVLTLALGIGANTAMFSVVDAVVFRPLPFPDAHRLVVLWETSDRAGQSIMYLSPPNFADWRSRSRSFQAMGVWRESSHTVTAPTTSEQVFGASLSHDLLDVLQVRPAIGRAFTAEDDRPGGARVVLISHGLWQRWFGGRPDVLGQSLQVDGESREVIGVMPGGFRFPVPIAVEGVPVPRVNDVWTPLALDLRAGQRRAHFLLALGRLAPDVDADAAERELAGIAEQLAQEHPASNTNRSARVVPYDRQVTGDQRPALRALTIAVGLVLLLACANVAGLLLARGVGRRREMAIRQALGAGRFRLVQLLLAESLVLSTAGALAGLLLASWIVRSVRGFAGPMLPRLDEVVLDGRALAFTALACLAAAVASGLAPILQVSRARATAWLKDRGSSGGSARLQATLVVLEVALSVVILAGAALLGGSFLRLMATDPGFNPQQTLTARVSLPPARYPDGAHRAAFVERTIERLRASPGITAAAAVDALALADDRQGTGFVVEGDEPAETGRRASVNFGFVTPGYFEAMGIPLLSGRAFDSRDRAGSLPTIIVNESFARRYLGDREPIGRRITMGFSAGTPREVVGVVGDERHVALGEEAPPGVYVSSSQVGITRRLTLIARTAGDPAAVAAQLRTVVREIDPQLALYELRTMEQIVSDSASRPRFSAMLIGLFAFAALLLAAVGVYGVISQLVGQRTREFGVRMALGAAPSDIGRLVAGYGLRLALAGVLLGLPAAFLFSQSLGGLLYGVSPFSPLTYASVGLALALVALAATAVPARRATTVDPLVALRAE